MGSSETMEVHGAGPAAVEGGVRAAPGGADGEISSMVPGPSAPAEPAYGWRGLMLDSARTFWSVEEVCGILDLMGRYRLNRLHWHLTDDSGWRIPVPGYERLTEVGAHLPRPDYALYGNVLAAQRELVAERAREIDTGGYYTASDIAMIVAHAGSLGIEIMPEVDLPGHMAAAIHAYPELGDPRLVGVDPAEWDHPNDLLWPSDAATGFLTAALTAVMDLFPFPVVHIGGDECKHWVWESDPELVASWGGPGDSGILDARAERARSGESLLSVNGPGSGVSGIGPRLQGLFTDHARSVLAARARRIAAWDELVQSPTAGDELIFAWRGGVGASTASAGGHEWIYADSRFLYLNRVAGDPEAEPPGMFGVITPRQIIEMPVPGSAALQGIQAAVWTEFILDREHLHYQLFPRLLAVAERAWCGHQVAWEEFAPRLEAESSWLRERGILPARA